MSWSIAPRSMDVGAPRGPGSDVGRALVPPNRAGLGTRSHFAPPSPAPGVLRAEQPKILAASPRSDRVDPELKSHPALPRYIFFFPEPVYLQSISTSSQSPFFPFLCVCFSSFLPLINHSSGPASPINYSSHLDLSEMQLQMQFNLLTHDR